MTQSSITPHETIATQSVALVTELLVSGKSVATAESCTGGWIAKALTDVPGSSAVFGCGIVSYSNAAKASILGVTADTLRQEGAVSEAVVREMVGGVLKLSGADLAVAVSGIAGPDGGSAAKPVGTVWFAFGALQQGRPVVDAALHRLAGDRTAIRAQSVVIALRGLLGRLAGL
ncbi:MAG: nicotinamide-nucleotide amidohydrolase family protein [Woeseia sp.]